MPHHHGFLHHFAHHLDRAFEVEAFARSHIQLQSDGVQGFLTMHRQVRALGQVLADQSIDVLDCCRVARGCAGRRSRSPPRSAG